MLIQAVLHYRVPISGASAIVAILASGAVGILFGTLPANRAAQLRYSAMDLRRMAAALEEMASEEPTEP